MPIAVAAASSCGVGVAAGGRSRNEDNFLVCGDGYTRRLVGGAERREALDGSPTFLVAVCDGMGGHDDGDRAAALAVEALSKLWLPGAPGDPLRALLRGVQDAHRSLYWQARERGPVTMGTTLTAAWLVGRRVAWIHVGDSRLYRFRAGRLERWTSDHTRNEFARRDAVSSRPDWNALCQSFLYGSRGLGDNTGIRLDGGHDYGIEPLEGGDRLVLCTDGVSGALTDVQIARITARANSPEEHVALLLEGALEAGTKDNLTAVVCWVREPLVEAEDLDPLARDDSEETVQF